MSGIGGAGEAFGVDKCAFGVEAAGVTSRDIPLNCSTRSTRFSKSMLNSSTMVRRSPCTLIWSLSSVVLSTTASTLSSMESLRSCMFSYMRACTAWFVRTSSSRARRSLNSSCFKCCSSVSKRCTSCFSRFICSTACRYASIDTVEIG